MQYMIKSIQFIAFISIISVLTNPSYSNIKTFVYSGGCFWCTEADTEKLNGVIEVISGFTGGTTKNPKYYIGKWGDHREAALVKYDPNIISLKKLIKHVFKTIDFEDNEGQFCDRGRSYSPAIYYKDDDEKLLIESLSPEKSVVPIEPESKFYPVREEHQNYYKKNSLKYYFYRFNCKRDQRLSNLNK